MNTGKYRFQIKNLSKDGCLVVLEDDWEPNSWALGQKQTTIKKIVISLQLMK